MSKVLIITGMHRSATSLAASLFEAAGVHLGSRMLEPNFQNPLGFFEDRDFFEFHENALHRRGQNILAGRDFVFAPDADECAQAERMLAARAAYPLWGWKDPRTCLFWEFWQRQLPDADWFLVYRHPYDVLLSLMRRREAFMPGLLPALEAWFTYNSRVAELVERAPPRVLLCHAYAVVDRVDELAARCRERFSLELPLNAATRDALYQPAQLHRARVSPTIDTILTRVHPEAMSLYARLDQRADLPAPDATAPEESPTLQALAQFATTSNNAATDAQRGLLWALLGVDEPATLEYFLEEEWRAPQELQAGITHLQNALAAKDAELAQLDPDRAVFERLANEREQLLKQQEEWVAPRMDDLRELEANPFVRALRRLGLVPRGGDG